jgi:hypothetical protein
MLPSAEKQLDDRYHASSVCRQLYDELSAYTLSLQDAEHTKVAEFVQERLDV